VLFVAMGMSLAASTYIYLSNLGRNKIRFEHAVDEAREQIATEIETYIGALRGAAGLFASQEAVHDTVNIEQFRAYVDRLDLAHRYHGAQGIGFSMRVSPDQREAVRAEIRKIYGEKFDLDPPNPAGEFQVVYFLEPLDDRNTRAIGYDMSSEAVRKAAMERAVETGEPALSGAVVLKQEDPAAGKQQPGFVIYVPVYRGGQTPPNADERRQKLLGFVYSPFRADDLFQSLFTLHRKLPSLLRIGLYDVPLGGAPQLLHEDPRDVGYPVSFSTHDHIELAGRTWLVRFETLPQFDAESSRDLAPWVMLLGGCVSFILFLLTRAQAKARRAAERMNDELQVTERALRYSESRFRRLAESNLIGVVFSDIHGGVSDGNDAYFKIIGCTRADALAGRVRWDAITPPEWRFADEKALHELMEHGVAEPFEKEFVRPDGTRVPVLVGVALLEGSATQTVAFTVDLTERHRTERDLVRAMQEAEAANRAKDQFLAVLSHELRTPLTPVLALSAAAQHNPAVPQELRDDFAMIRRNVELEAKLIDDLLDLTRIGRGKIQLHLEPVDVHQVVHNAIQVLSAEELAAKHLDIELKLDARLHHVRGDMARLQQVFWNLLKNAVKFTPAGGRISIASANDQRGQSLIVSVTDTGMGIEPHLLPRIFDAFEQGQIETSRSFGGLGLGLAISKGLVVGHGGTITAQSPGPNEGSTFTVTLATVPAPRPAPVAPAPPRIGTASHVSILLVEDHEDTALALKRLLQRSGYQVAAAGTVQSALNLAAQTDFDVVVSDIGLPDGSGIDLMRQIRAARASRGDRAPRGIALTGYGMEEDVARSMEAGFVEHLTKPINYQKLQSAIERVTAMTPADYKLSQSS
jgi:PAS domain S-box-containing protein